jgi:hypothetical protein
MAITDLFGWQFDVKGDTIADSHKEGSDGDDSIFFE